MNLRRLLVSTAAGALALTVTVPASASASASATTASITVTGGSLTITAPTDAGGLGGQVSAATGGTLGGRLGQVQVVDARSAPAGSSWVASVVSTDFVPTSGPVIPAAAVSYTAGTITKVGTASYLANDPTDLTAVTAAVTATEITGDNTATWNPTVSVTVPAGVAAGVYNATITHSVV